MSRLHHADGSLAACPVCRRLHDRWDVPPGEDGYPDWNRRVCAFPVTIRRDAAGRPLLYHLCTSEAPRDLVAATERVRLQVVPPLVDLETTTYPDPPVGCC